MAVEVLIIHTHFCQVSLGDGALRLERRRRGVDVLLYNIAAAHVEGWWLAPNLELVGDQYKLNGALHLDRRHHGKSNRRCNISAVHDAARRPIVDGQTFQEQTPPSSKMPTQ